MRRRMLILLVLLPALTTAAATRERPVDTRPFFAEAGRQPLVIAHQGGEGLRPSNTMASFAHAVALGVDVLEMDIHGSADNVLVTIHDDTVDRTTDGSGRVNDLSLDALKALDAGYYWTDDDGQTYPFRGQGITIATLEEIFQAFPDYRMNIEIKQAEPSIAAPFCDLLRRYGMTDQVLVASFRRVAIEEFRAACPEVATSLVEDEVRALYIHARTYTTNWFAAPGEAVQVPEYSGDTHVLLPRFIHAAQSRNLDVHAWTINEVADLQRMIDLGVDGIITDYPDRLLALLGR